VLQMNAMAERQRREATMVCRSPRMHYVLQYLLAVIIMQRLRECLWSDEAGETEPGCLTMSDANSELDGAGRSWWWWWYPCVISFDGNESEQGTNWIAFDVRFGGVPVSASRDGQAHWAEDTAGTSGQIFVYAFLPCRFLARALLHTTNRRACAISQPFPNAACVLMATAAHSSASAATRIQDFPDFECCPNTSYLPLTTTC
jgi:hypothetical protein